VRMPFGLWKKLDSIMQEKTVQKIPMLGNSIKINHQ